MVASVEWDHWGVVVGVDKREVVRTHLGETVGVLVDERGLEDRIRRTWWGEVDNRAKINWRVSHVIRPLGLEGAVADREEENLDRVRETDIVRWLRVSRWREGLAGRGLDLLNEDVTGGAGHTLTLVVRDNSVVGPDLGNTKNWLRSENRRGTSTDIGLAELTALLAGGTSVVEDEEVRPVAEREVDAHLVIWEGSSGKGNTRITAVEEGEGKIESKGVDSITWGMGTSHIIEVTNHIVVTIALASWDSEGSPEVKVVVIKASGNKIVESNAALTDDVVHEVTSPAETTLGTKWIGCLESNLWSLETKPSLEEVITRTRDRYRPLLVERWRTRGTREDNWNLGEPSRLASLTDEVSSRLLATIHILFDLVESG